ncbi:hypothetical protein FHR81_003086 [Actinoalloteichus hoggarensis]|uniref:hypothetical protein n=1 Tax=Actinoalloteichus hoggarensis TaxID=1470176 RepID=UPI000B8B8460|nr:hypothetical protein [Actinoalloteichus hoggarensis]MBB5922034.1 hypothetical protein [Actinoalloteichus hoggarensis]
MAATPEIRARLHPRSIIAPCHQSTAAGYVIGLVNDLRAWFLILAFIGIGSSPAAPRSGVGRRPSASACSSDWEWRP